MRNFRFLLKGLAAGCVFLAVLVAGQVLVAHVDSPTAIEVTR